MAVLFRSTCDLDRVVTSWRDERGAVVDMASRQTHSSVLPTINTCLLTSQCISRDVFDPEKRQSKLVTWRYFAKKRSHHITNESLDWPRLAWPCLLLPSTSSKDKSQKNFRFIFQECSQTTHSRSALLLSHLQTNVDQCLRFGLCNFFYWRCIIFCLLVFYAILFLSHLRAANVGAWWYFAPCCLPPIWKSNRAQSLHIIVS